MFFLLMCYFLLFVVDIFAGELHDVYHVTIDDSLYNFCRDKAKYLENFTKELPSGSEIIVYKNNNQQKKYQCYFENKDKTYFFKNHKGESTITEVTDKARLLLCLNVKNFFNRNFFNDYRFNDEEKFLLMGQYTEICKMVCLSRQEKELPLSLFFDSRFSKNLFFDKYESGRISDDKYYESIYHWVCTVCYNQEKEMLEQTQRHCISTPRQQFELYQVLFPEISITQKDLEEKDFENKKKEAIAKVTRLLDYYKWQKHEFLGVKTFDFRNQYLSFEDCLKIAETWKEIFYSGTNLHATFVLIQKFINDRFANVPIDLLLLASQQKTANLFLECVKKNNYADFENHIIIYFESNIDKKIDVVLNNEQIKLVDEFNTINANVFSESMSHEDVKKEFEKQLALILNNKEIKTEEKIQLIYRIIFHKNRSNDLLHAINDLVLDVKKELQEDVFLELTYHHPRQTEVSLIIDKIHNQLEPLLNNKYIVEDLATGLISDQNLNKKLDEKTEKLKSIHNLVLYLDHKFKDGTFTGHPLESLLRGFIQAILALLK